MTSATAAAPAAPAPRPAAIDRARLPVRELFGTALQGLKTRRLRAALSALGIAIGIGAMVAVVGVSASAQANLLAEIDALGTNLLTVTPGQTFLGANEVLPDTAVPSIEHQTNVHSAAAVYQISGANVYRTPLVPAAETGGIGVDAAAENLPAVMGTTMASGHFLGQVANEFPEAVLGWQAAQVLQINHVAGHLMVYLGNTWFTVIGIMRSAVLDTSLDATVFISLPEAERLFQTQPNPSEIYVRANQNDVVGVSNILAATADPQNADGVQVSRPSDALQAQADAKGQFTTLLLGLGAVVGELPNSFLKRQLDIGPGSQRRSILGAVFVVFDQGDFVLGAWLLLAPVWVMPVPEGVVAFAVVVAVHMLVNVIGYTIGARKTLL